jgi:hypothetical protein
MHSFQPRFYTCARDMGYTYLLHFPCLLDSNLNYTRIDCRRVSRRLPHNFRNLQLLRQEMCASLHAANH